MYGLCYSLLLASRWLLPASGHPRHFVRSPAQLGEPLVLHPINLRAYESATGLHRREEEQDDFSDLDPKTQSQLIYGRPGGMY